MIYFVMNSLEQFEAMDNLVLNNSIKIYPLTDSYHAKGSVTNWQLIVF